MYQRMSINITNYLICRCIIDNKDKKIYEYSVEVLLSGLVYAFIATLTAVVLKSILQSVMFFIGFLSIRKFAGGYHADTYTNCHILFWINQFLMIVAVKAIPLPIQPCISIVLSILSVIFIFAFAPIENENKPFSKQEAKHFKTISRFLICIASLILTILLSFKIFNQLIFCFVIGISSVSISLLAAKIKKSYFKDKVQLQ